MNLVNELQESAERDDVLTVLRKARRLASKLSVSDIDDWLKAEQEGYGSSKAVPKYRMIRATMAYKTNGYIPSGFGSLMNGIEHLPGGMSAPMGVAEPISTIMNWIEADSKNHGLYLPVSDTGLTQQLRSGFDPWIADQITFLLHLNMTQVKAIPDQIKDKVLDWALALERAGAGPPHYERLTG